MIKAIETRYKGYRFRSRLEARWAAFLDALGVEWEYEKEGFDLGEHGWYLPDFWLPCRAFLEHPDAGEWVEIKPVRPDEEERRRMAALVEQSGHRGFIFWGNPWPGEHGIEVYQHHHGGRPEAEPIESDLILLERNEHAGTEFESCGAISVQIGGKWPLALDGVHRGVRPGALSIAFDAARGARFEHGEAPR